MTVLDGSALLSRRARGVSPPASIPSRSSCPPAGVSPATTSCCVGCGRPSPSIHRLSSTPSCAAAAAELPDARRRAAGAGRPGRRRSASPRRRARGGSGPRRRSARRGACVPAGDQQVLAAQLACRRRQSIEPACGAGRSGGHSRHGSPRARLPPAVSSRTSSTSPTPRPSDAVGMDRGRVAVAERSASNGRRWCAARRPSSAGSAPSAAPAPPQLTISRVGAVADTRRPASRRSRRRSARGGGGGAASNDQHGLPAPAAADSPSRAPGAAGGCAMPAPSIAGGDPAPARHCRPASSTAPSSPCVTREQRRRPTPASASVSQSGTSRRRARYRRRAAAPAVSTTSTCSAGERLTSAAIVVQRDAERAR